MMHTQAPANLWEYPPEHNNGGPSLLWPPNGLVETDISGQLVPQNSLPESPLHSTPSSDSQMYRAGNSQLYRAIESQVAFIDGDPARHEDLELFYYRFVGPDLPLELSRN